MWRPPDGGLRSSASRDRLRISSRRASASCRCAVSAAMPPGASDDGTAWRSIAGIEATCSQLCVRLALLPLNGSATVTRSEADAVGIVDGSAIADFREARPVLTRRQILLAG